MDRAARMSSISNPGTLDRRSDQLLAELPFRGTWLVNGARQPMYVMGIDGRQIAAIPLSLRSGSFEPTLLSAEEVAF